MTLSLAALHLMHMCETQSSFLAKSLEVGDYYTLPIRTNEPSISSQLMLVLPFLIVCPPTMTADSTVHKSNHMCIVQSMFTTECSQVGYWSNKRPFRINEPDISFHVIPFSNAILVCPTLIRLKLALPHCQPMHRREIQPMQTTKFMKVEDRDFIAIRINEALPNLRANIPRRTGDRTDVESEFRIGTLTLINPFLLSAQ